MAKRSRFSIGPRRSSRTFSTSGPDIGNRKNKVKVNNNHSGVVVAAEVEVAVAGADGAATGAAAVGLQRSTN